MPLRARPHLTWLTPVNHKLTNTGSLKLPAFGRIYDLEIERPKRAEIAMLNVGLE
jgi:hypothetical protein